MRGTGKQQARARQAALAALGTSALQSETLAPVLQEAARRAAEGTDTPFCKICEYRAADDALVVVAGIGWRPGVIGAAIARADRSNPVGRAFRTGEPVITRDLRGQHDFDLPPIYGDHAIISSVNVVIARFGVLEVDSDTPRSFSDTDIIFLTGLANVCAEAAARLERERRLRDTVAEQRIFLRELEHRVRNHLHLIVSHAQSLAARTGDAGAKRGYAELTRRILALATLYDRLLGVHMAKEIDLGGYLGALCETIREVEATEARRVRLACASDPVQVPLDRATSIGIIANELVANSLEHAFGESGGTISIELRRASPELIRLAVTDDGSGMPPDPQGIGLSLVRRLAQQLGGRLELKKAAGTRWELELGASG